MFTLAEHLWHVLFNDDVKRKHAEFNITRTVKVGLHWQREVQGWTREDSSCRDTARFLWHSSHMFPIWSTKPPIYIWNGPEHNSALHGMWSMETQPDGTPSDRLGSQSKTLLTESHIIEDSRPTLFPNLYFRLSCWGSDRNQNGNPQREQIPHRNCPSWDSTWQPSWKYLFSRILPNL